jgi:predicted ArsR family transcriptional regulator
MSSETVPLGPAQRRIVDHLKRSGPCTTAAIADALGVTTQAVRPPLAELEARRMVIAEPVTTGVRGRPPLGWALAPGAMELFPDRHGDLSVELIDAMRSVLDGDEFARVLAERDRHLLTSIEACLPAEADVAARVEQLAAIRVDQGFMAEVRADGDDLLLIEHHCPVSAAARSCRELCDNELDLFRQVIGSDVERTQHLLSDGERCVYRIRTRG